MVPHSWRSGFGAEPDGLSARSTSRLPDRRASDEDWRLSVLQARERQRQGAPVCAVGPEQYPKRACAIRIQHWCRNSGPCPSRDRRLKTTALSGQARTLRLYSELRFEEGEIDYLEVLAALAMRTGDGLQAMRLLTASGRLRGELGSPLPPVDELEQRIDA